MATAIVTSKAEEILLGESTLPADFESRAIELAVKTVIDPKHPEAISAIGAEDQQKSTVVSNELLKHVQIKDTGESGKLLSMLAIKCKSVDVNHLKPSWIGNITRAMHLERVAKFMEGYQDTVGELDAIKAKLETARTTLLSDVASLNMLYEQNLVLYQNMKVWTRVCQIKMAEMDKQIAGIASTATPGDQVLAQQLNDTKAARDRLDKHEADLELTAMIRLQFAPKIRIVQSGDLTLAEKMQSSVINTMSIWKDNLALAITQVRQKESLAMQNQVDDATNAMLRESAEMMHTQSVGIAKASERGVVDIETLQHTQKELLATIDETAQIAQDGRKAREDARKALTAMTAELQAKLTGGK